MHGGNWDQAKKIMPAFLASLNSLGYPLWGKVARRLGGFEGESCYTQSYVVPINRDVDYQSKGLVVPADKIRNVIADASFRAIMNRCICRDGFSCKNYPRDIGCLQLGEGARNMVRRGIAREASREEALAHLERAAGLGMVALCAWVEMEALFLGVPRQDHERYLEICLCCPCCCVGLRSFKNIFHNKHMAGRFNTTGWRARGTEGCTGCGKCAGICPMQAISVSQKSITVYETCIGCGLCATHCPKKSIVMDELEPMKERIQDYFWGLDLCLGG